MRSTSPSAPSRPPGTPRTSRGTACTWACSTRGCPSLDVVERAAIGLAVAHGVIIVAAAGNAGTQGMGFPGAYAPVISVAAVGWRGQWVAHPFSTTLADCSQVRNWWRCGDVAE